MTSRIRQAAPGSRRPFPVVAGDGGRSLASTRETATRRRGGEGTGHRGDAVGRAQGSVWSPLSVEGVPDRGTRLSSRKPAEAVLVVRVVTASQGVVPPRAVTEHQRPSPRPARTGSTMSGAQGKQAGRSGQSVVKREAHRQTEVHPSKRVGCHTSRGFSSLKCGLQKSVRSISGCSPFGRKIGRRSV